MPTPSFDLTLLIVYFFYGLAFYGLGLTMALEAGRSPDLAEARTLRPLAAFGLIHGTHEWLESYLMQAQAAGTPVPDWMPGIRLVLLGGSYLALLGYGISTMRLPGYRPLIGMRVGLWIIAGYMAFIAVGEVLTASGDRFPWMDLLDNFFRYFLAVPGAALAVLSLRFNASQARLQGRPELAAALWAAAIGFAIYGATHLFVHPLDMFPARYLNTETFRLVLGFPVQLLRASAAMVITLGLLRATHEVEKQRRVELSAAQQSRLEALQQVQAELTRREQLRRELLRHTVQAQEDERARIARELHDETSQVLSALSLDLATLHGMATKQPESLGIVERLQSLSREMSQGLYRLVHDLRPAQLDDLGLVAALHYLLDESRSKGLQVQLDVAGPERPLDPIRETVLFRVAQEALSNTIRHAGTDAARVHVEYRPGEVILKVTDSGRGFDPSQEFNPPRGWGLAGMRERVEALGGELRIQSGPGAGTQVEAVIPLDGVPILDQGGVQ